MTDDFSTAKWEIQIRYTTGWETLATPSFMLVDQTFASLKRRYRTLKLRLLRNGKRVR